MTTKHLLLILLIGSSLYSTSPAEIKSYTLTPVIKKLTQMYGGPQLASKAKANSVLGQTDPLAHLVGWQRTHYPQAWIASTFYDYRTVSHYRRRAGLHLGYDIAMPYGTPVSAAWPGTVTDIIPWSDTEYGVSVTDLNGVTATYGHIRPLVRIGQKVNEGDIIAKIEYDHVDVKIRDAYGQYIPFGENSKFSTSSRFVATDSPKIDRNTLLTSWLVTRTAADEAKEELFLKRNSAQKLKLERRALERKIALLASTLKELSLASNSNLVSRKKLEELKVELASSRKELAQVQASASTSLSDLEQKAKVQEQNLKEFESWAKQAGLSWKDVENLVAEVIKKDAKLNKIVVKEKQQGFRLSSLTLLELEKKRDEGRAQLARLEELFAIGGISLQEVTDERLRQELLEEEYALRKGLKNKH